MDRWPSYAPAIAFSFLLVLLLGTPAQSLDCQDYTQTPQLVATLEAVGLDSTRDVLMLDGTRALALGPYGLSELDLTDPWNPLVENKMDDPLLGGLAAEMFVLVYGEEHLAILDRATLELVVEIPGAFNSSLALSGELLAVVAEDELRLFSLGMISEPQLLSATALPTGSAHKAQIQFSGNHLVVALSSTGFGVPWHSTLHCFDITDPVMPLPTGTLLEETPDHDRVMVRELGSMGRRLYLVWEGFEPRNNLPITRRFSHLSIDAGGRLSLGRSVDIGEGEGALKVVTPLPQGLFVGYGGSSGGLLEPGFNSFAGPTFSEAGRTLLYRELWFLPGRSFVLAQNLSAENSELALYQLDPQKDFFAGFGHEESLPEVCFAQDLGLMNLTRQATGNLDGQLKLFRMTESGAIPQASITREGSDFLNPVLCRNRAYFQADGQHLRWDLAEGASVVDISSQLGTGRVLGAGNSHLLVADGSGNCSFWLVDAGGDLTPTGPSFAEPADFFFAGDHCFLDAGRRVISLADPQIPTLVQENLITGEYLAHDATSLLTDADGTFHRYDLANPLQPVLLGSTPGFLGDAAGTISVSGDLLYLSRGEFGLDIYRWDGLTPPTKLGSTLVGNAGAVHGTSAGLMVASGHTMVGLPLHCEDVLPVTLQAFAASTRDGRLEITWRWGDDGAPGQMFRVVQGHGLQAQVLHTGPLVRGAGQVVTTPERGHTGPIQLRLEISEGGVWQVLENRQVLWEAQGRTLQKLSASPNPFNPRTVISFSVGQDTPVQLDIFDLRGRLIRTLINQHLAPGDYDLEWDGRDLHGRAAGSGRYLVMLRSDAGLSRRGITLLR